MKAHSYDMARGTRDQEKQHFMESIFQQARMFLSEDSTKTKKDFLPSSFSSQSEVSWTKRRARYFDLFGNQW